MKPFTALRISGPDGVASARLQQMTLDQLSPGDVTIEVHYSSINYKDALAGLGKGKILKSYPLNGGIDASGVVLESADPRFRKGQEVLVTGCGLGETCDGGYSQMLRVPADAVVPLPAGLSTVDAMILGTAGFTAALALHRMQQNGQTPALGPILVTGASGGVGSFAVQLFSQIGYEVIAVSGKPEAVPYLRELGAAQVLSIAELNLGTRPLEKVRFGGAVDNVGGALLAQLLAHIQLWGNVASIGMAQGLDLPATVMPFILRGVSLLGTSSNNCGREVRHLMWQQLAGPWKPKHLQLALAHTVGLNGLLAGFEDLLHRRVQGRILVEVRS